MAKKGNLKNAELVFFASADPDGDLDKWEAVLPDHVPANMKDPDVIGRLLDGMQAQHPVSKLWYRAVKSRELAK